MNNMINKNFFSVFFLIVTLGLQAQIGHSFDVGISIGAVSIQSDYGERDDIKSGLTGNVGFGTSLTLYKNFYDKASIKWYTREQWFKEHFKLKATISYHTIKLNHFGAYVENESDQRLQKMSGTGSVVSLDGGVEFHLLDLSGFSGHNGRRLLSPYVNISGLLGISNATVSSTLGNYEEDITVFIPAYQHNSIYTDTYNVGGLAFGGGTRLKIGNYTEINIESQWKTFFSDKIDGLKPRLEANKYTDWTFSLLVGIVYEL